MLSTDPSATADGTDLFKRAFRLFEAKPTCGAQLSIVVRLRGRAKPQLRPVANAVRGWRTLISECS